MADKTSDPLVLWQKMFGEMQKGFASFARPMSPSGGGPMGAQKQLGDFMERYLVSMNMPSRAQMVGIAQQLHAIEGQLSEIKALLQEMQKAPAPSSGGTPKARGKRGPSEREEK